MLHKVTFIYMYQQLMRTEFVNFKVSKQRHVGESKMEGECCNYVIILKKRNTNEYTAWFILIDH